MGDMENLERTFMLLKPDAVERAVVGEIISRIESTGLHIFALQMLTPSRSLIEKHYPEEDIGKRLGLAMRTKLIDYVCSGPCVACIIAGTNSVAIVRKLVGVTDPAAASPGTIRGDLASASLEHCKKRQQVVRNLVHASASPEEAKEEIGLWFPELS